MRSHHLSRALLSTALALFVVSLETFAQTYTFPVPQGFAPLGSAPTTSTPLNGVNVPAEPAPAAAPPGATGTLTVAPSDVAAAGFGSIQPQAATADAYPAPVAYFRVAESVAASRPAWGGAADLLAVSLTPIVDRAWAYNDGDIEILDIAGRSQARISRSGWYIAVTGPDASKVAALAGLLKEKPL